MKKAVIIIFFLCSGCNNSNHPKSSEQSLLTIRSEERIQKLIIEHPGLTATPLMAGNNPADSNGSFVKLNPLETGIDFQHVWNLQPKHREQLRNSFIAAGVAIGDYDNDGLLDIFFTRQADGGSLYKNLGNFKFKEVTAEVGINSDGMWSTGATFSDINNDGWLDLYVCGFDSPNRLYINNKGKFRDEAGLVGLDFKGASVMMSFADYDLDGDLDAYLLTNRVEPGHKLGDVKIIRKKNHPLRVHPDSRELAYFIQPPERMQMLVPAGQFDYLYRNDNGRFVDVSKEAGIGDRPYYGLSAIWWDYNNDGWPDIYVANDYMGPDHLFRNNGPNSDGEINFTDVAKLALPHTPWFSMGSDYSDINNDGRIDFLASDMAGSNHYRDKLSMGSMSGPESDSWFLNFPDPPQYMRNALYLNTGTERFMEVGYLTGLAKTDWTWTVKFGDLDNDGLEDVYFTNGMSRDFFNGDLMNRARQIVPDDDIRIKELEMWEKERPYNLKNKVYKNKGTLDFEDLSREWGLDHFGVSTGSAMGDLDGDGDLDLVVNGFEEPALVYRNDVAVSSSLRIKLIGQKSNRGGIGTKIVLETRDGSKMLRYVSSSRGFMSSSEPIVHFGLGDKRTVKKINIFWPSGIDQEFQDIPTGFLYSVTEPNFKPAEFKTPLAPMAKDVMFSRNGNILQDAIHREIEYDDFLKQKLLPNKLSQLGPGMAWGDVDQDGDDDLFIGGAAGFSGKVYYNSGGGIFNGGPQPSFTLDAQSEDMGALFFDSDLDGDLDLYVVSGGVECVPGDAILKDRLYTNDGRGNFVKENLNLLPDIRSSGSVVTAADIDGDMRLELFVGGRVVPGQYPEPPQSYILKNTGSKYEDVTDSMAPEIKYTGLVTSALFTDVDGDHLPDLMVTYDWGPVRYFHNESGQLVDRTVEAGLDHRIGWYNSISGGDLDKDGDIDYLVGNFGYNTKYQASPEKPEILYYGDFEGNGIKRIIEAKYEDDICLPHRGLGCSSDAMPIIRENFPTYHQFAVTPLKGIYTDALLNTADKFEINDLASGILFNQTDKQGNVKFEFKPLPRIAQASPIFGSVINDINGDGNLDLYVVQNFFGPQRETGYMDGGVSLLLLGDGNGSFKKISPDESGLIVPGAGTSLTISDLNSDGRPDYVVGVNNDGLISFENQSQENFTVIRFPQLTKKQNYIGAKIEVFFMDNSVQLHELYAGSGYLSQSAPNLFFISNEKELRVKRIEIRWSDGVQEIIFDIEKNIDNLSFSMLQTRIK